MADNFQITEGAGKTIAAKDIGSGVLAQRVQIQIRDGSITRDIDEDGLPVQMIGASNQFVGFADDTASVFGANANPLVITGGAAINSSGTVLYLKMYNTQTPAVGSTPPTNIIPIPVGFTALGTILGARGIKTFAATGWAATVLADISDTTAVGTTDLWLSLFGAFGF